MLRSALNVATWTWWTLDTYTTIFWFWLANELRSSSRELFYLQCLQWVIGGCGAGSVRRVALHRYEFEFATTRALARVVSIVRNQMFSVISRLHFGIVWFSSFDFYFSLSRVLFLLRFECFSRRTIAKNEMKNQNGFVSKPKMWLWMASIWETSWTEPMGAHFTRIIKIIFIISKS